MNYHVYILFSRNLNRFYVGSTIHVENRLIEHNSGESAYTSQGMPWSLLWTTRKPSFRTAEALEFKLKNLSRLRKIRFMQKYAEGIVDKKLLAELVTRTES